MDTKCQERVVSKDILPPWTIFQSVVEPDQMHSKLNIVFNPIIMVPPNKYRTVYTTLKLNKEQKNAVGKTPLQCSLICACLQKRMK